MSDFPGEPEDPQVEDIRDSLIILANRGKIKSTERFLKKATPRELERIKLEYDRQQTEFVDELVSKYLINGISTLMRSLGYIDDECEDMKKTLIDNDLVKKDLSDLSGYITRNVRYIGIATLAVVVGGYALAKRYGQQTGQSGSTNQSDPIPPNDEDRQDGQ